MMVTSAKFGAAYTAYLKIKLNSDTSRVHCALVYTGSQVWQSKASIAALVEAMNPESKVSINFNSTF